LLSWFCLSTVETLILLLIGAPVKPCRRNESCISLAGGLAMPSTWTAKDERQYEHIKKSEQQEGRSVKRAKAIAAATVNKRRSAEGRTKKRKGAAARPAKGSR